MTDIGRQLQGYALSATERDLDRKHRIKSGDDAPSRVLPELPRQTISGRLWRMWSVMVKDGQVCA